MGESIYRLAVDAVRRIGEDPATTKRYAPAYRIPAANDCKDEVLEEILKARDRALPTTSSGYPTAKDFAAGVADYALPVGIRTVGVVEVMVGSEYVGIDERRSAQKDLAEPYIDLPYSLSPRTTYQLIGESRIYFNPPPASDLALGWRVWGERDVPDLIVGKVVAAGAQTLTLASTHDDTIGQRPADPTTDIYVGTEWEIVAGAAGAVGQVRTCVAYNGPNRILTMDTPWSLIPVNTDTYSTRFPLGRWWNRCIRYGTAALMLAEAKEDGTSLRALFEESLETLIGNLQARTPGHVVTRGFGHYDDDD